MGMRMPAARRRAQFPILELAGIAMILFATILMVAQLGAFSADQQKMPTNLVLGGIPISGLSSAESRAYLEQAYGSPLIVMYRDQELRLDPSQVSFRIDSEAMLTRAADYRGEGFFWADFWKYIWGKPESPTSIELVSDLSTEQLSAWLADVAARYDSPPSPAQPVLETLSFVPGQPGYTLDQAASQALIEEALRRPIDRTVSLVVTAQGVEKPGLQTLKSLLIEYVASQKFQGVVSLYVIDLKTGEEMKMDVDNRSLTPIPLDCEVAYASTSTMKIPIMVEFFRYLDWVPEEGTDDYKNLIETMTQSGNVSANTMLYKIGFEDAQVGAESVSLTVQELGLQNTFLAAPYINDPNQEVPPVPYISTPAREAARSGQCIDSKADEAAQTTVQDLATLLDTIYQCAEYNGGALIAAYPNEITQSECQMMLDFMSKNAEAPLIRAGVPQGTFVAHKHGWTYDTHGDAGIVMSPGGDYVLTMFLWADTTWMPIILSFPVMEGISTATFNYFNPDMVNVPRQGQEEVLGADPGAPAP